jgi:hypothetical protein
MNRRAETVRLMAHRRRHQGRRAPARSKITERSLASAERLHPTSGRRRS